MRTMAPPMIPRYTIKKGLPDPAQKKHEVDTEIHPKQGHEHGTNALQVGRIPRYRVIFDPKAAGTRSAEGGTEAVKKGHPPHQKKQHAQDGKGDIDEVEDGRGLPQLGHQLTHTGTGAFRPKEVDAVSPLPHGHHRQQKHQDPHSSQPMGKAAPEQQAPAHPLHIGEDGGPCGGEAGDDLKQGVHIAGDLPGQPERKGSHSREKDPAQAHNEEPLPGVKASLRVAAQQPQDGSRPGGDSHGGEQGRQGRPLPIPGRDQGRGEEEKAFQQKQEAHDLAYHFTVH